MSVDNYLRIVKFSAERFAVIEGKVSLPYHNETLHGVFNTRELASKFCDDFESRYVVEERATVQDYEPKKNHRTEPYLIHCKYEPYFSIYSLNDQAFLLVYGDMKRFGREEKIVCVFKTFDEAAHAANAYIAQHNVIHAVFEGNLRFEI